MNDRVESTVEGFTHKRAEKENGKQNEKIMIRN